MPGLVGQLVDARLRDRHLRLPGCGEVVGHVAGLGPAGVRMVAHLADHDQSRSSMTSANKNFLASRHAGLPSPERSPARAAASATGERTDEVRTQDLGWSRQDYGSLTKVFRKSEEPNGRKRIADGMLRTEPMPAVEVLAVGDPPVAEPRLGRMSRGADASSCSFRAGAPRTPATRPGRSAGRSPDRLEEPLRVTSRPRCARRTSRRRSSVGVSGTGCPPRDPAAGEVDDQVRRPNDRARARSAPAAAGAPGTCEQLVGLERLQHVVVGARLERGDLVAEAVAHGEHDDGDVGERPEMPQRLEAVDAREREVEHDEVGRCVRSDAQRFLPAPGFHDVEVPVPEACPQRSPQRPASSTTKTTLTFPSSRCSPGARPRRRTASGRLLAPHATVVCFDEGADDREPEPRPVAVGRGLPADELAEDLLALTDGTPPPWSTTASRTVVPSDEPRISSGRSEAPCSAAFSRRFVST